MNVGSLFSGIGGIEIGFERQGFHTEWFVEYEPYAQAILRKNFPDAKIYGDIKEIDFRTVPKVDILTGGFPCQDISNAGKRAGIKGSRSSLWKYYCEAIRILRPRYAIIENVAALAGRGLNVVLADLAQIGYDAEWYVISASSVGAHHQRQRLFIIAYPSSDGFNSSEGSPRGEVLLRSDQERNDEKILEGCGQEQQLDVEQDGSVQHVSDSNCKGLQRGCPSSDRRRERGSMAGYWSAEPDVGRVAHGISNRMDRIKCLGNAVVPQVAEVIAKAIKEYEGDF